jgi:hypothetical protein
VPVEFLADEQAAKYAVYDGPPVRAELERFFFLDDADRELVASPSGGPTTGSASPDPSPRITWALDQEFV